MTEETRAMPHLPEWFPPAPDYSEAPPGWRWNPIPFGELDEVYHPKAGSDALEIAWTRHKLGDMPPGYVLDDAHEETGDTARWGVELVSPTLTWGIMYSFDSIAEAREFAWRCAEKPHHVAFTWTHIYVSPGIRVVLEWTDEELLQALNYIAERAAWRALEPERPTFYPPVDED